MSSSIQNERDPKRPTKNFYSALDRDSLNATRENHNDLKILIANLSDKLTIVSNSQEKEFLSAYRVHMLGVQLELKELKLKVAKAELSLQDDGEVSKLEDECNWFRTETNRLNAHCSSMQSDIQSMKNRLTTLRDQNDFLSSQLKAVMKRSRVIEVELEYNQQDREERKKILPNPDDEDDMDNDDGLSRQSPSKSPHSHKQPNTKPLGKSESAIQLGRQESHHKLIKDKKMSRTLSHVAVGGRRTAGPLLDSLKGGATRAQTSTSVNEAKEDFMSFGVSREEQTRTGDPIKLASHVRQLNDILDQRCNAEIELEECVKIKFEEVVARRSKVVMTNSKNRYIQKIVKSVESTQDVSDMGSQLLETLDSVSFSSGVPNERAGHPVLGGVSGLGLEYFTDSDRKEIMVSFLSKPEVFQLVVNKLQSTYYS